MRRIVLGLLALLLAGCAQPAAQQHNHAAADDPMTAGTVIDPPTELVDFTMPSSTGAPLSLADLKGRPTLIFFGFTHCPDVCPTTMAEFKRAKEELGDIAVNYVLISLDPERDTPEAMAAYLGAFDPAFVGLQGDDATLRRMGRDFGLYYERKPPAADGSYDVEHSSASYLLDAEARLAMVYSYGTPYTTFVNDIRAMQE